MVEDNGLKRTMMARLRGLKRWSAVLIVFALAPLLTSSPLGQPPDPPAEQTLHFQHGLDGYTAAQDTLVEGTVPGADHGVDLTIATLYSHVAHQGLIRFDHLFGSGPGQIPWGSTIASASLTVHVTRGADASATISLHRMLIPWSDADNWQTLGSGIQTDDTEALIIADSVLADPVSETLVSFDSPNLVTALQAWSNGEPNYGWAVINDQSSKWVFSSSEAADTYVQPLLAVTFYANASPTADAGGPYEIAEGDAITLNASASSDPEGNPLTYAWDMDNDSSYGDVTGASPTLTWAQLQSFGIDDGDAIYPISVQVDDGQGGTDTALSSIVVDNTAPILNTTGDSTVKAGASYSLELSADDPGEDTITEWIINWGDGDIDTIVGNPPFASHTYTRTGFTFHTLPQLRTKTAPFCKTNCSSMPTPSPDKASSASSL